MRNRPTPQYDPREAPAYTVAEAAQLVRVPVSTLKTWIHGEASSRGILVLPPSRPRLLQRARFGGVAWGLPILKQIALGLCALHEAGVIHRDLKPGNVLLDGAAGEAAPVAKISDFGIARFGELGDGAMISPEAKTVGAQAPKKHDLTGTGALLGTPYYMAPEAARGGRSVDAAADMFAFGILAYEVLTGRPPFGTPPVLAVLTGQAIAQPAPMQEGGVDGAAREVVLRCLAFEPRGRPSARRVCEALGAV